MKTCEVTQFLDDFVDNGGKPFKWYPHVVGVRMKDIDYSAWVGRMDAWRLAVECLDRKISMMVNIQLCPDQRPDGSLHYVSLLVFEGPLTQEMLEWPEIDKINCWCHRRSQFIVDQDKLGELRAFIQDVVKRILRPILNERVNGAAKLFGSKLLGYNKEFNDFENMFRMALRDFQLEMLAQPWRKKA